MTWMASLGRTARKGRSLLKACRSLTSRYPATKIKGIKIKIKAFKVIFSFLGRVAGQQAQLVFINHHGAAEGIDEMAALLVKDEENGKNRNDFNNGPAG